MELKCVLPRREGAQWTNKASQQTVIPSEAAQHPVWHGMAGMAGMAWHGWHGMAWPHLIGATEEDTATLDVTSSFLKDFLSVIYIVSWCLSMPVNDFYFYFYFYFYQIFKKEAKIKAYNDDIATLDVNVFKDFHERRHSTKNLITNIHPLS